MKQVQRADQRLRGAYRSIRVRMLHNCKVYQNLPEVSYSGDRERSLEPSTAASNASETRLYAEAQISSMTNPLKPSVTLWTPYQPRKKICDCCRDGNRSAGVGNTTLIPIRAPTITVSATSERRLGICGSPFIDAQYPLFRMTETTYTFSNHAQRHQKNTLVK